MTTLENLKGIEHRIAELVGDGQSYKAIAAAITSRRTRQPISVGTVRGYVNRIASHLPDDGRPAYRRVMFWVLQQRQAA